MLPGSPTHLNTRWMFLTGVLLTSMSPSTCLAYLGLPCRVRSSVVLPQPETRARHACIQSPLSQ